ncbi:MAG: hypothetical protein JO281_13270 [Pseudonocardiales bacterium]|nr:hypothetical protein [Pseudonocardiales bacterium]
MPVDLAAVQADDALLDLIGQAGHTPSDTDDQLTRVLAAWRCEVHAEPFSELVDTDTALAVIHAARQPIRRRNPVFGPIAAAAAVLVIAFSAVGLVAKSAQPGDPLWGVTQMLYSDYAHSVETAATVRTELNDARTALREGKPEQARAKLQHVQQQLPAIGEAEGRTDLTARHRQLEQMLNESPDASSANPPGMPMFPPSMATGARRAPSTSPKSSEPPTSAGSTTTSNSITESPSSTAAARPDRIPPGREYSGPGPRGYPGPDSGPSGPGPSGSGTMGGGGTPGRDFSGGATTDGTEDGATTNGGGPPASGSPNSGPAGSGPPSRGHVSGNPPSYGVPPPPGCDRPGPRPPYCG